MKPRHRAQHRLDRIVVGDAHQKIRSLEERLCARASSDSQWEFLDISGTELVWDHRPVPLPQYRLPKIKSHAPLLKRVIRNPYSMECEPGQRIQQFDSSRPALLRLERPPLRLVFRASREARHLVGPAHFDRSGSLPPAPFARCRLALEDRVIERRFGDLEGLR